MNWQKAPLKLVAPGIPSKAKLPPAEPVWLLTLDQIESNTGRIVDKKTGPPSEAGSSTNIFDESNVLYSKLRPYLNKVICPNERGIATTELVPLRPLEGVLERRFLTYYLSSSHFLNFANLAVAGVKMPRIIMAKFWKHEIPLPPYSEQCHIADILDQADALRKKRAEADEKASRILQALFYDMFGDPATNPKDWPVKELGAVCPDKPQYGANAKAMPLEEGMPRYVRITDITDDGRLLASGIVTLDLEDWEQYRLQEGDVLFARSGNTVGKTYMYREIDGLCAYAGYLIRFRPDANEITPWYLFALTQTDYYRNWVELRKRVAGQPNINGKEYASLPIPCPPRALQDRFSKIIEAHIHQRDERGKVAKSIDHLFDVLMHRAFSGTLTERWRESHMEELLAEMEEQAEALESSSASNAPKKATAKKRHGGHDMYNKAALAAYITDRCHSEEHPMGRVKLAKLFYLCQKKAEIQLTDEFVKRAAGPLDDQIHKFLNLAKKQKWVELGRAQGDFKPVRPGKDLTKVISQVQKLLAAAKSDVDSILDDMKGWRYTTLERWATILEATLGLREEGKEISVVNVKSAIFSEKEWAQKLNRAEFSDEHIRSTLAGLKRHGFLK